MMALLVKVVFVIRYSHIDAVIQLPISLDLRIQLVTVVTPEVPVS